MHSESPNLPETTMTPECVRLHPAALTGTIPAVDAKSYAHRLLMAAALADVPTRIRCRTRSADILATVRVMRALGAEIEDLGEAFLVRPIGMCLAEKGLRPEDLDEVTLDCGESGTTERFILPIVAALGRKAAVTGAGRLAERPLSPLSDVLRAAGVSLSEEGVFPLHVAGRIGVGDYAIAGNVSSQFVGGLLYALSLQSCELVEAGESVGCDAVSTLELTGTVESAPYIRMTEEVLRAFGAEVEVSRDERKYVVRGADASGLLVSPGRAAVEGDWSNAAFWLVAGAVGAVGAGREGLAGITVTGLRPDSAQGDRTVAEILARMGAEVAGDAVTVRPPKNGRLHGLTVDAAQIPDLVPVLSVAAACAEGVTTFVNAGRLRIKESDRLATTAAMLRSLGVEVTEGETTLTVAGRAGRPLTGGTVSGANDHRIVMAAAVAATVASGPVVIEGARAARKSYPDFFRDYAALGGRVEAF